MNRNFAIGCVGVIIVIAALAGVLLFKTPEFLRRSKAVVKRAIVEEMRVTAMENAWTAPSARVDSGWFPPIVGVWKLERAEERTGIPELGIQGTGYYAVYRTSLGPIEVNILPSAGLERPKLLPRVEEVLSHRRVADTTTHVGGVEVRVNRGSSRITTTRGNRTEITLGGEEHTRFWWVKDMLFIFRARGHADSELFPEEFLRALSPPPPRLEPALERP